MSISFNHPQNTITSTGNSGSLNLVVLGGSPTNPRPIRFNSSSVIMPVQSLPTGEAGAIVFDKSTKTMKYHDGSNWVELLSASDVVAPLNVQINNIINSMGTKIDTVNYSSAAIPMASISGTNLNIVFPNSNPTVGSTGLYTSAKTGSIMYYSLASGQTYASIREQMSGKTNGQSGRTGSQTSPWLTSDGWCLADGMWWTWQGENGTVLKQTPNLNQSAYFKGLSSGGITKTDSPIGQSGSLDTYTFTIPDHYHGVGQMNGNSGPTGDDGSFIFGRSWNDGNSYRGLTITGDLNRREERSINGSDPNIALSTTNSIYLNASQRTISHSHNLQNFDVAHFNVAVLYNIAEPSLALSESVANTKFVLKSGDTMTGNLNVANTLRIAGNSTNIQLYFTNSTLSERAAIYHQSTTNTLRLRSNGGSEVYINGDGSLYVPGSTTVTGNFVSQGSATVSGNIISHGSATVSGNITSQGSATVSGNITSQGRNVVRAINGITADGNGNLNVTNSSGTTSGWHKDEGTGIITQWGYIQSTGNDIHVNFPRTFSSACYCVTLGQIFNSHADQGRTARLLAPASVSGFDFYIGSSETGCYWQAIGR
ncbi:hypothetical protein [Klebsiella phage phiKp_21]|nr:hypothetical protein [Klebsiella phage phiKp_21]